MPQNFICVKWGTLYPCSEVNALFTAIKRHTKEKTRFFCLTDDAEGLEDWIETLPLVETPLQKRIASAQPTLKRGAGALRKISVFDPDLIPDLEGPIICLDIDILVTGSLDALFDFAPEQVCMPPPFKAKSHIETKGEGSVIRFDPKLHGFLYHDIANNLEETLAFSMGSEQRYTSFTSDRHGALTNFPADWIVSFLRHCRAKVPLNLFMAPQKPANAKIVCFPSKPKAHEAVHGHSAGLKSTRPAPWIQDYL